MKHGQGEISQRVYLRKMAERNKTEATWAKQEFVREAALPLMIYMLDHHNGFTECAENAVEAALFLWDELAAARIVPDYDAELEEDDKEGDAE